MAKNNANELLDFLSSLAENNNKEWMDANRNWYLSVKEAFLEDVAFMLKEASILDPAISLLTPKDCIFRMNRDVRFSPNKAPYKSNMSAYFAAGGKKSMGPGFYVHIQPGESFVGGGIYMPPADILKKIRKEIDYSGAQLEQIIQEPEFTKTFGSIEGDQLKNSPKDYATDHPYIELLKYKSFVASAPLSDQSIRSGKYLEQSVETFRTMKPFYDFLKMAVEEVEDGSDLL
ncbi:DUF2461 domain-containing protein [Penaeicola halotolerans]|uniref:DUF2461 domain-containing protein n=1 Tax=Penaeicola halotolerans TaxID=2793196 RepID=UPI001CF84CBB|nr:DUF2461 domain-containing protein [Penaeicola halotolerans]